jgi:hypothetical protein
MISYKLLNNLGVGLALTVTTVYALTPFLLLPIPTIDPYQLLFTAVIVGMVLFKAYLSSGRTKLKLLVWMAAGAALSLGTRLIIGFLPPANVFEIPIPNVIGPLLRLHGEAAYDAEMYELWCEVWLALAVLVAGFLIAARFLIVAWRRRQGLPGQVNP